MKIAFINCRKTAEGCTTSGCFRALSDRTGHFAQYAGQETQLLTACDCGGCANFAPEGNPVLEKKMNRLREIGVEKIHFATCVGKDGRCPHLAQLTQAANNIGIAWEMGSH